MQSKQSNNSGQPTHQWSSSLSISWNSSVSRRPTLRSRLARLDSWLAHWRRSSSFMFSCSDLSPRAAVVASSSYATARDDVSAERLLASRLTASEAFLQLSYLLRQRTLWTWRRAALERLRRRGCSDAGVRRRRRRGGGGGCCSDWRSSRWRDAVLERPVSSSSSAAGCRRRRIVSASRSTRCVRSASTRPRICLYIHTPTSDRCSYHRKTRQQCLLW